MPIFDVHCYLGGSVVPGVAHNAAAVTTAMQHRGIDAAVLMSAHACRVDPISGNRILRAMLDQAPNLYGCLVAHTNRADASITIMRELMTSPRFVGMAVVGPHPGEPVLKLVADEVLNAYRRYGKPLYLLAPDDRSVQAALEIARTYQMLKVVLLGMGGEDWRTAIVAARTSTNIYLETSGVLDRAKLPAAVEALGVHRIVFGSSSPHVDPAAAKGLIDDSVLSDDARQRVLFENARKLFEIEMA